MKLLESERESRTVCCMRFNGTGRRVACGLASGVSCQMGRRVASLSLELPRQFCTAQDVKNWTGEGQGGHQNPINPVGEKSQSELLRQLVDIVDRHPGQVDQIAKKLQISPSVGKELARLQVIEPRHPTKEQYRRVMIANAAFFFIFGVVDNGLMIVLGDYIDHELSKTFVLSTLGAAALGNCVSNGTGVGVGAVMEHLGLVPQAELTNAQQGLKNVTITRRLGSFYGMLIGCLVGMSPLLFMDARATQRKKRQHELNRALFGLVVEHIQEHVGCDRVTLYLVEECSQTIYSTVAQGLHDDVESDTEGAIRIPIGSGYAGKCAESKQETGFERDEEGDKKMRSRTVYPVENMLCIPIINAHGKVLGVVQMLNKPTEFTADDRLSNKKVAEELATLVESANQDITDFVKTRLRLVTTRKPCQKCHNGLMPDAIFCRACGWEQKANFVPPKHRAADQSKPDRCGEHHTIGYDSLGTPRGPKALIDPTTSHNPICSHRQN